MRNVKERGADPPYKLSPLAETALYGVTASGRRKAQKAIDWFLALGETERRARSTSIGGCEDYRWIQALGHLLTFSTYSRRIVNIVFPS